MRQVNAKPYNQPVSEVLSEYGVIAGQGLASTKAKSLRDSLGENKLPEAKTRSAYQVFLNQFKSILIVILFSASVLSAFIGNIKDAIVILCVVLINASVGFYQEYRAEKSLAALKKMLPITSKVMRDGTKQEVNASELVPGDLVLLEAGDKVPADGRIITSAGLEIDESSLTGESQPIAKTTDGITDTNAALGDRINMAYMNTMITRGRAEVLVTSIGQNTEMGLLSQELAETDESETPLQQQLNRLGKVLGTIAIALVSLLAFFEWLRGTEISHIMIDAIALAVAAIPEGLPVVVTVTLALGMHNMARHRAIVKRLASVETLGCTTVICSDKTGTLTLNQMTVRSFYFLGKRFTVSGEGYVPNGQISVEGNPYPKDKLRSFLLPLTLCNDSHVEDGVVVGDPMEAALKVLAEKGDLKVRQGELARIAEIPFDTQHKFMATFHKQGNYVEIFVKGAPDVLIDHCQFWETEEGNNELTSKDKTNINDEYTHLASDGLRGLMIAHGRIPVEEFVDNDDLFTYVKGLTFMGLVGLMDPPRAEAKQAISECKKAGIAVKMITGDHKSTGLAIAKELGLEGKAITGTELDKLDSSALAEIIDETSVFARVSPEHKVKIVRALQAREHVVAMTGDGVNDAPALKGADIGIAMGITGTEVSKEAATMILTDDNFATIVKAIKRGRTLYDNIIKFVRFQLSTTIGAILTVFFAPLVGLPEPFTPVQILWVAIIMDGPPAISLALDSSRPGIMKEKPRGRGEPILPISRLGKIIVYGVTMMVGTLLVLRYGVGVGDEPRALTLAFTTFVLFQVFNVFNARNESKTAFNSHLFDNKMLWFSLTSIIFLQILAVHWEAAAYIFGTVSLSISDWLTAALVASSILVLEESRKLFLRLSSPNNTNSLSKTKYG